MIDVEHFRLGMHDYLQKNASIGGDLNVAWQGAKQNTTGINPLQHPINYANNAWEGAKGSLSASIGNQKVKGFQDQGAVFNRDQYGAPTSLDIGASIKNYGSNLMQQLPQGVQGFLGQAGNFINQYKTPLMLGAGALGAGALLHKMFSSNGQPGPQYGQPHPYYGGMPYASPQALQKAGGANMSMLQLALAQQPEMMQPQVQPQLPSPMQYNIHGANPKAKHLLNNPHMQAYLTNLIKSVERNQSAENPETL